MPIVFKDCIIIFQINGDSKDDEVFFQMTQMLDYVLNGSNEEVSDDSS